MVPILKRATLAVLLLASLASAQVLQPANGGTGQTSYTDGQALIGRSSDGSLQKSVPTGSPPIVVTGGPGTLNVSCPTCLFSTGTPYAIGGPIGFWGQGSYVAVTSVPWMGATNPGTGNAQPVAVTQFWGHLSMVTTATEAANGSFYSFFLGGQSDPSQPRIAVGPSTPAGVYSETALSPFYLAVQGFGGGVSDKAAYGGSNPSRYGVSWATYGVAAQSVGAFTNSVQVLSSTRYTGWGTSTPVYSSTEPNTCSVVPFSATLGGLIVSVSSQQNAGGTFVFTLRYTHAGSAASTSIVVTVSSTTTNISGGYLSDLTHTQALSAGDCFDLQQVNNYAGTSTTLVGWSASLTSMGSTCGSGGTSQCTGAFIFPIDAAVASGANRWFPAHTTATALSTEAPAEIPIPGNMTIGPLYCYVTANPGTSTANVTVEHNGADTGLTLAIPTSGCTNNVCSDTNTAHFFTANYGTTPDTISLKVNQASGTNVSIGSCSVGVQQTS